MSTTISQNNFYNLDVVNKFQQIGSCSVSFSNLSAGDLVYIDYDKPLRFFINGRVIFTGIIKRVDKEDNKEIWHVTAESAGCLLRDYITETDVVYTNKYFFQIIQDLLPSDWVLNSDGVTTAIKIDYHVTPGNALKHIVNLCRLANVEWGVSQEYSVDGQTVTYGDYVLTIADHMGSTESIKTFTHNVNCVDMSIKKNIDKVTTSIQAVGTSPEAANLNSICTYNMEHLVPIYIDPNVPEKYSESYLSTSISAATTYIPLVQPFGYVPPCIVEIEGEKINCSGYGSNFVGLIGTRGYLSTTATAHATGVDVINCSRITLNPTSEYTSLPVNNGTVWIGMEKVYYSSRVGNALKDLTRGVDNTKKYSHQAGIFVRSATTDTTPDGNSPVGLYGLRQITVDAIGVTKQDGVDRRAQRMMAAVGTPVNYGKFTYLDSDMWFWFTLGDAIKVVKRSEEEFDSRIIGVHYNMYKPVEVEYGDVDELILDDFAKVDAAHNAAVNKNDNAYKTKVLAVDSNNSNVVQVKLPDGTTGWVEVV